MANYLGIQYPNPTPFDWGSFDPVGAFFAASKSKRDQARADAEFGLKQKTEGDRNRMWEGNINRSNRALDQTIAAADLARQDKERDDAVKAIALANEQFDQRSKSNPTAARGLLGLFGMSNIERTNEPKKREIYSKDALPPELSAMLDRGTRQQEAGIVPPEDRVPTREEVLASMHAGPVPAPVQARFSGVPVPAQPAGLGPFQVTQFTPDTQAALRERETTAQRFANPEFQREAQDFLGKRETALANLSRDSGIPREKLQTPEQIQEAVNALYEKELAAANANPQYQATYRGRQISFAPGEREQGREQVAHEWGARLRAAAAGENDPFIKSDFNTAATLLDTRALDASSKEVSKMLLALLSERDKTKRAEIMASLARQRMWASQQPKPGQERLEDNSDHQQLQALLNQYKWKDLNQEQYNLAKAIAFNHMGNTTADIQTRARMIRAAHGGGVLSGPDLAYFWEEQGGIFDRMTQKFMMLVDGKLTEARRERVEEVAAEGLAQAYRRNAMIARRADIMLRNSPWYWERGRQGYLSEFPVTNEAAPPPPPGAGHRRAGRKAGGAAAPPAAPALAPADDQAVQWLKAHPTDPNAPAVRERLRAKGIQVQ